MLSSSVSQTFRRTKPSFLEGGLPCASLSAECQQDNNARQHPPQNRLHIWWARRPPTICRAAILAALLPHDLELDESLPPSIVEEPSEEDLEHLPPKLQPHRAFFERLLSEVEPTPLTPAHRNFLRAMGIIGDTGQTYWRITHAQDYLVNGRSLQMPAEWGFRYPPAFSQSPSGALLAQLAAYIRERCGLSCDQDVVLLDPMAGGGSIPLEGVRYGLKVYANELNPVASLVLKATMEYPARYGRTVLPALRCLSEEVATSVGRRLAPFFHHDLPDEWWPACESEARLKFKARTL